MLLYMQDLTYTLKAKILCTLHSLYKCRAGAEPREWWRGHKQPECAGCTDSIRSTTLPTEQTRKDQTITMSNEAACESQTLHYTLQLGNITFFFWWTVCTVWKQAARQKRRPTNRLLSEKTSATIDHCHTSLDRAKLPPASTAPGPDPAILREGTHIQSVHSDNFRSGITTKLLF